MTIYNHEVADKFNRLADLLEIEGANPFRVRAYRNAAQTISNLPKEIRDLIAQGTDLTTLPNIGSDLANKIITLMQTGTFPLFEETEKRTPAFLSDLMKISGLGPKHIKILYDTLAIRSILDLEQALRANKISQLPGFGLKTEQKLLAGLAYLQQYGQRIKIADATAIAQPLINYLKQGPGIIRYDIAGSYRRCQETVGDLDILVSTENNVAFINYFINYKEVREILAHGETRATVLLRSDVQVDIRAIPLESYGAALLYFTGSKAHVLALRRMAQQQHLKINEYGVYRGRHLIASKTEAEIYQLFNMAYIEPELRENRGEFKAAKMGLLPSLITLDNIRGDLHNHTHASDGQNSLEEMADAAIALGYDYLAITEHSVSASIAHGLNIQALWEHIRAIDQLNEKLAGKITLLKASEIDILEDGSLDYPDEVLQALDLRVCSIHSRFGLNSQQQTERIIRAMDNSYFNILGHPTGRLISSRPPYNVDMERIMVAAKERSCFLELNAQPERLDLMDIHCKLAKEIGVKIAISTDSHHIKHLNNMSLGISQARRGWLTAEDVINTRTLPDLQKLLKRV